MCVCQVHGHRHTHRPTQTHTDTHTDTETEIHRHRDRDRHTCTTKSHHDQESTTEKEGKRERISAIVFWALLTSNVTFLHSLLVRTVFTRLLMPAKENTQPNKTKRHTFTSGPDASPLPNQKQARLERTQRRASQGPPTAMFILIILIAISNRSSKSCAPVLLPGPFCLLCLWTASSARTPLLASPLCWHFLLLLLLLLLLCWGWSSPQVRRHWMHHRE